MLRLKKPEKGQLCWVFQKMTSESVPVRFLGFNTETDGWMRFQFLDPVDNLSGGEYTSCPPDEWGKQVGPTRECVAFAAVRTIMDRLYNPRPLSSVPETEVIEDQYERVYQRAKDELIRRAREVLRKHRDLDEFVMAMGSWFFTKNSESIEYDDSRCKAVTDFMDEWDSVFNLSGDPMRFHAYGDIVTEW